MSSQFMWVEEKLHNDFEQKSVTVTNTDVLMYHVLISEMQLAYFYSTQYAPKHLTETTEPLILQGDLYDSGMCHHIISCSLPDKTGSTTG